jgi:pyrroline-5-carboxylate reductase
MTSIAFLGAGAMGEALVRGLLQAGIYAPQDVVAFDVSRERLQSLAQELSIRAADDVVAAASEAEVVVLAVKPQVVGEALELLRRVLTPQQTLISIAAGVTTKQLESHFDAQVPCVRVMPNTPALIGQAASAIALGTHATGSHGKIAHRIFDVIGLAIDVPEKLLDAVTGLSGSGPAYVYVFIEALSDAGVKMGCRAMWRRNLRHKLSRVRRNGVAKRQAPRRVEGHGDVTRRHHHRWFARAGRWRVSRCCH